MSEVSKMNLGIRPGYSPEWRFVGEHDGRDVWQAPICDNDLLGSYTVLITWDPEVCDGYAQIERNFERVCEIELDHSRQRIRDLDMLKLQVYSTAVRQLWSQADKLQTELLNLSKH